MKMKNKRNIFFLLLTLSASSINAFFLPAEYRAQQAFNAGEYDKAYDYLVQKQVDYPDDSQNNYNLATVNAKLKKFDATLNVES